VVRNTLRYTEEAFDIGTVEIGEGASKRVIHVMNEHMAVTDGQGERVACYPDVITTLDSDGNPVSAGKLREGLQVSVLHVQKQHIPLSSSVTDPSVYPIVEKALGMNFTDYALAS
jgi:DUF917 family protein